MCAVFIKCVQIIIFKWTSPYEEGGWVPGLVLGLHRVVTLESFLNATLWVVFIDFSGLASCSPAINTAAMICSTGSYLLCSEPSSSFLSHLNKSRSPCCDPQISHHTFPSPLWLLPSLHSCWSYRKRVAHVLGEVLISGPYFKALLFWYASDRHGRKVPSRSFLSHHCLFPAWSMHSIHQLFHIFLSQTFKYFL